jgi:hypothetical protein
MLAQSIISSDGISYVYALAETVSTATAKDPWSARRSALRRQRTDPVSETASGDDGKAGAEGKERALS